jgi:hypothetical protein
MPIPFHLDIVWLWQVIGQTFSETCPFIFDCDIRHTTYDKTTNDIRQTTYDIRQKVDDIQYKKHETGFELED